MGRGRNCKGDEERERERGKGRCLEGRSGKIRVHLVWRKRNFDEILNLGAPVPTPLSRSALNLA